MSLFKQLWLAIAFLMGLAFIGSFVASFISAKQYLEEQLFRKNIDNASSLALSLADKASDMTIMELYISSQFDTGHYQLIHLMDTEGNVVISKINESTFKEAPDWFINTFPIDVKPGVAQVSNGWNQIGTLTLSSHTRFAYQQLWGNAKNLLYYFVLISLIGGLFGSFLLRWMTKPLDQVVLHAQAIGERRFITTDEPKTLEFKALIQSMNKLSRHVKTMLDAESSKLEKWRRDMQHDDVSGLFNREPTLNHLNSFLSLENEHASGAIVLLRIVDLFQLNQKLGRKTVDSLLARLGDMLIGDCKIRSGGMGIVGRLNGSDFLVILPTMGEIAEQIGQEVFDNMNRVCREVDIPDVKLLASSTAYHYGEKASDLLSRIDTILTSAIEKDTASYIFSDSNTYRICKIERDDWATFLSTALQKKRFSLQQYPVYSEGGQLLFLDSTVNLIQEDSTLLSAGFYMPHVSRLGLGSAFNLVLVEMALDKIRVIQTPLCISLSASILAYPHMMAEISHLIASKLQVSDMLWIEIPEYGVFQNLEGFRQFCEIFKPLGCKLGIAQVRQEALHLGELHDLGLDYVKIDTSLTRLIDETTSYQVFLRGLCTMIHSIGLIVIAEGVANEAEWLSLKELGIDGGSGEFFTQD